MGRPNVQQTVPFLWVSEMDRSLVYYVGGLGFSIRKKWEPDGKVRWAWLKLGDAALMLQQFQSEDHDAWQPSSKVGEGVAIYFICEDALAVYRELQERGVECSEPQVGNGMWEFGLSDPDGYRFHFESPTDAPEETKLSEI